MNGLWVLYDERCNFCQRCAAWLSQQRQSVTLRCLPSGDPEVQEIFWGARRPSDDELVVVDSDGGVYRGGDAFLMALWALTDYRKWALQLARPSLRPFARGLFEVVSSQRKTISMVLGPPTPKCADGACAVPLCLPRASRRVSDVSLRTCTDPGVRRT